MPPDATAAIDYALKQSRAIVFRSQQRSFLAILRHVWQRSRFYRDLYSAAGIKEHDLADIKPHDLPIIDKKLLMENFDRAVTDPRLRKNDLQRWVHEVRDSGANSLEDFIVFRSSGSSGTTGIFVCAHSDWQLAARVMASRLPAPVNYSVGKTRAAFSLVSHGNFSGVSGAARLPSRVYETLLLSVLDTHAHIVKQLNQFQPHQLHGYAGSIHELSQLAITGKLRISPKRIFVGGDKRTEAMERDIGRAWAAPICDLYSASEARCIAYRQSGFPKPPFPRASPQGTLEASASPILRSMSRPRFVARRLAVARCRCVLGPQLSPRARGRRRVAGWRRENAV